MSYRQFGIILWKVYYPSPINHRINQTDGHSPVSSGLVSFFEFRDVHFQNLDFNSKWFLCIKKTFLNCADCI